MKKIGIVGTMEEVQAKGTVLGERKGLGEIKKSSCGGADAGFFSGLISKVTPSQGVERLTGIRKSYQ